MASKKKPVKKKQPTKRVSSKKKTKAAPRKAKKAARSSAKSRATKAKAPARKAVAAKKRSSSGKAAARKRSPRTAKQPSVTDAGAAGASTEVREIFREYDRDGSGSIDRSEFSRLLEALGMTPDEDELAVALDVVDANHSGKISWAEFQAWWSSR